MKTGFAPSCPLIIVQCSEPAFISPPIGGICLVFTSLAGGLPPVFCTEMFMELVKPFLLATL